MSGSRLLGWLLPVLGVLGITLWLVWPTAEQVVPPAAPPPPAPPPPPVVVPAPVVAPVVELPQPSAPEPEVVAPEPPPVVVERRFQYIVLGDGRGFIGDLDRATGAIQVQASVRGGSLTRMPPITVRVDPGAVVSAEIYDGRWGAVTGSVAPQPVDPVRAAAIAESRQAAANRAEQRRVEAAERERQRKLVQQRTDAERRAAAARESLRVATQREEYLTGHARTLEEDRRLKLELVNGLQLQLNAAQDRWNLELQTLGPRVTKADGKLAGGPTPATETLVASLQKQIGEARKAATAAEQAMRAEAAERQRLIDEMPARRDEIQAADDALRTLDG